MEAYKKLEQKLQQEFHSNVHLLTLIYPPRNEFQKVFKENMFIKSNKSGFQEVVYYLLGIIEPDKLKEKIPTWPVLDLCMEHSFRSEVLNYINELSSMYEEVDLPKIATSHLISPGGVKFTKFMFKLSKFVLYVHVKRSSKFSNILLPVKPTKRKSGTQENLSKLNIYNANISSGRTQLRAFADVQKNAEVEAKTIMEKQKQAHEMCKIYETKLEVLKKSALCDDLKEKDMLVQCAKILKTLTDLRDKMYKCNELSNYLNGNDSEIEYIKGTSNFQDKHENLDLIRLFEGYNETIDRQRIEMKPVDLNPLLSQIERFQELNEKFTAIIKNTDRLFPELTKLINKVQEISSNNFPKNEKKLISAMKSTGNHCNSTGSTDSLLPLSSTVIVNDTFTESTDSVFH